ncbi:MAG: D-sedoheptulose 7-phosphate isomerase [Fidelibacterota bacterium]|nr:MAG: D-sedoheptulose 7-phosphate isomerase [Candidatus Neomarinimicrobiota bacterium]
MDQQVIFKEHIEVIKALMEQQAGNIEQLGKKALEVLRNGGTIFFCGNGGSAADSQHLAAELVGRYERERDALPAVALTVDTSALTAIGNDYGFEDVFHRQLLGLGKAGDLLVAISTSGNSPNVLKAVETARRKGIFTVALTGKGGGKLAAACDQAILVPSNRTSRIQEAHIIIGHMMCQFVEEGLSDGSAGGTSQDLH